MRMSNSSELILTEQEKTELKNRVIKQHLEYQIEEEYDLFYENLKETSHQ